MRVNTCIYMVFSSRTAACSLQRGNSLRLQFVGDQRYSRSNVLVAAPQEVERGVNADIVNPLESIGSFFYFFRGSCT